MRRNMGMALSLVGLFAVLGGVIAGMFSNSSNSRTATINPETPYVYTASGVLDQLKAPVTFTLTGSADAEISYALGAPVDVEAWAQGLSSTKITGLTNGETLDSEKGEAAQDTGEIPALLNSDMWLEKGEGKGEVTKTYRVQTPGTVALIATSSDGKAPKVELTWQTKTKGSGTIPVILIGILTSLIGGALLFLHEQERRRMMHRRAVRERKIARRAARAEATTDVLSLSDIAETSRSAQSAATGGALGAGILMASPRAQEFRSRELSDDDRIVVKTEAEEKSEKDKELFKKKRSRRRGRDSFSPSESISPTVEKSLGYGEESEKNSAGQTGGENAGERKTGRVDEAIQAGKKSPDSRESAASSNLSQNSGGIADAPFASKESSHSQEEKSRDAEEKSVTENHDGSTRSQRSEQWRSRWNFALNDEPTEEK